MTPDRYIGSELELFATALRWKRYALGRLRSFAAGRVLEVGAGIAASTPYLLNDAVTEWTCLEPDAGLAERIRSRVDDPRVRVAVGDLQLYSGRSDFDGIFYIDVLEHIEDDGQELKHAASLLKPGGRLVVLAPAHAWLYSSFDRAIGHFRRYNRRSLTRLGPAGLRLDECFYLDSAGLLASAANRLLLKQSMPRSGQIAFWDRVLVPLSRVLDPLLGGTVGKTVVAAWSRWN
jgi:SAM-dependent methyltransferase